jgi:plasmid stabilization system protein ParE
MPRRAIDLHPLAIKEMRAASQWYRQRSPWAAQRFGRALQEVMQWIETRAELGSPFRQEYRWMRLRRFPYLVYYKIRDPRPVLIHAVAHGRRNLGYWLRRKPP